jgi:hypothetical protein
MIAMFKAVATRRALFRVGRVNMAIRFRLPFTVKRSGGCAIQDPRVAQISFRPGVAAGVLYERSILATCGEDGEGGNKA